MDEDRLIPRLLAAAQAGGARLSPLAGLGPGDDAALLDLDRPTRISWTVDDQVEGVHFDPAWADWPTLGRRAASACLSDLAAMGAAPVGLLVALYLPADRDLAQLEALYRGLGQRLAACDCPLLGGNVTRSPSSCLALSLSALGALPPGGGLLRSTAQPGDRLYVSGVLGRARLGLRWLLAGHAANSPASPDLRGLLEPVPRLELGRKLAGLGQRVACMDLSDGLARDLPRLLRASGVAAVVGSEALPAPELTPAQAAAVGEQPLQLAWRGGEDYELLVAGPPELGERLPELRAIGRLEAGPAGQVTLTGPLADETDPGFDHLPPPAP